MIEVAATYLALDIGGGSGRGIAGTLTEDHLLLDEVSRFENYYVSIAGKDSWDIFYLFHEMLKCIRRTQKKYKNLISFSVDMWGSDFAFLDRNGQPIGQTWCTRNGDEKVMEEFFHKVIKKESYFNACGGQIRRGNTVFQLYERLLENDTALQAAESLLMLPDYMGYLFTGKKYTEFTIGTTSQLIDPLTGEWNKEMIQRLDLSMELFCEIIRPGMVRYKIRPELQSVLNTMVQYLPTASHDTASAVTALQLQSDEIFCSSGTWSIIGIECDRPLINNAVYKANFSNEGTIDQRWRFQKDVMGMWCIQNVFRVFCRQDSALTWEKVVAQAERARAFRSIVNLEESLFGGDDEPVQLIQQYCEKTNQPIPVTLGELARCIYESMTLRYCMTIDQLKILSKRELKKIRIVGGGSKNGLLNQMIADATGMVVEAGPYESACIGNILIQAEADGKIQREEFSKLVKNSFEIQIFHPRKEQNKDWKAAAERYKQYSRCSHL